MAFIDKMFVGCAIFGGALFAVRLVLSLMVGHGDGDMDMDHGDFDAGQGDFDVDHGDVDASHADGGMDDSDASFVRISLQTVTAFFMMFGLAGLALRREANMAEAGSILGALVVGAFSMWLIGKVMQFMMRLQSSGTLNMAAAVGEEGSVYLTIPANGTGKVQLTVGGRFRVWDAICQKPETVKTGERVTVVRVRDDNTLIVDKL